ncbi:MAG TPA: DUF4340 domain-containing protein [Kiloniellales bacterium]|nr:DUF4340 domain-containing protein [Kiloniellales bacterium]
MQPRSFLLLLIVTVLAVAGAAAATLLNPVATIATASAVPALPKLAERGVEPAAIEVESAGGSYRLERRGVDGEAEPAWVLATKDGYPASADSVAQLLTALAGLQLTERLTDDPQRLRRLQLEPLDAREARSRRVKVLATDGSVLADLFVGRTVARLVGETEGGTYVRLGDETQAWLAAGSVSLPSDPLGFVDRRITTLPDDTVRRVVITHPDGTVVLAERESAAQLLSVETGLPPGTPADPAQLRHLAQLLEQLSFEDVAAASAVTFPAETVNSDVVSFDGIEVLMTLAEIDGQPWMRLSARLAEEHSPVPERKEGAEAFAAALEAKTRGWVYQISPATYQRLTMKPAELTGQ